MLYWNFTWKFGSPEWYWCGNSNQVHISFVTTVKLSTNQPCIDNELQNCCLTFTCSVFRPFRHPKCRPRAGGPSRWRTSRSPRRPTASSGTTTREDSHRMFKEISPGQVRLGPSEKQIDHQKGSKDLYADIICYWCTQQSNLLGLFGRLFASEQFTDVVVTAEGRSIRAHKVRLTKICLRLSNHASLQVHATCHDLFRERHGIIRVHIKLIQVS